MHTKLKTSAAVGALLVTPLCLLLALYSIKLRAELSPEIARIEQLGSSRDTLASEVFDRQGRKIGEFATERRYFVPLKSLPQVVVKAFLSAEDKGFYHHIGISPVAIVRAAIINIRGGGFRQGASTITQQLARLSFLGQDRTWERKIKEAILALAIEQRLSKDRILELYLNKIYLGNGSYGVESAARNYFRKHATELTVGEAAMIAGLAKSPSRYAPNKNMSAAWRRQKFVLRRMKADRVITKIAESMWAKTRLKVYPSAERFDDHAPYFMQQVAGEIELKLGLLNLATDGLKIYTTLNADLQRAAVDTVSSLITAASKKSPPPPGQSSDLQAALVAVDPRSGAILAMQGGSSFNLSQFNRAAATYRPIGQLIVPIYAALALEQGLQLTSHVDEDPYGGQSRGRSLTPTILDVLKSGDATLGLPLVTTLGLGTLSSFAKRLGLGAAASDFRLALGEVKSSPLQLALTYSAFAADGKIEEAYAVDRIIDGRGRLIYQRAKLPTMIVMSATTADQISTALESAVSDGHAKPKSGVTLTAGGMSSASDDLRDSWYVGVERQIVTTVWLGSERGGSRLAKGRQAARDLIAAAWAQFANSPACRESRQATRSRAPAAKSKGL